MKSASTINAAVIIVLLAASAAGAVILFQKHPWSHEPVEIILENPAEETRGLLNIHIDGAVAWPGWYMLNSDTTIDGLLATAGGLTDGVERSSIVICVSSDRVGDSPQRISINRADAWLLKALPGVGPKLAQDIIDYRQTNGPFLTTEELLLVPGIGEATYNRFANLITVE